MQNLEVISVNLWNILISLANLVILFWAVKKFLFKPVRKILAEREFEINRDYEQAEQAKLSARADEKAWHEQMEDAKAQADSILQDATEHARRRESSILAKAQDEAESIMQNANRVYGEQYISKILTHNPFKIMWRNIKYTIYKLRTDGI